MEKASCKNTIQIQTFRREFSIAFVWWMVSTKEPYAVYEQGQYMVYILVHMLIFIRKRGNIFAQSYGLSGNSRVNHFNNLYNVILRMWMHRNMCVGWSYIACMYYTMYVCVCVCILAACANEAKCSTFYIFQQKASNFFFSHLAVFSLLFFCITCTMYFYKIMNKFC